MFWVVALCDPQLVATATAATLSSKSRFSLWSQVVQPEGFGFGLIFSLFYQWFRQLNTNLLLVGGREAAGGDAGGQEAALVLPGWGLVPLPAPSVWCASTCSAPLPCDRCFKSSSSHSIPQLLTSVFSVQHWQFWQFFKVSQEPPPSFTPCLS